MNAKPKIVGIADMCDTDDVRMQLNYVNAARRWGMMPVVLPYTDDCEECRRQLQQVDVLLLAGGGDIASWRFGEPDSGRCGIPNEARDSYELLLMSVALEIHKPVFGICRGLQLINVAMGGTLWQDIPRDPILHSRPDKKWEGVHTIDIVPDSWLARQLGATHACVNSTHHQAIRRLAPGLHVTALAPDGIIEAVEADDLPIVAVQFHPERLLSLTLNLETLLS